MAGVKNEMDGAPAAAAPRRIGYHVCGQPRTLHGGAEYPVIEKTCGAVAGSIQPDEQHGVANQVEILRIGIRRRGQIPQ